MSPYTGTGPRTHVLSARFREAIRGTLRGGTCDSWSGRMLLDRAVEDECGGDPLLRQYMSRELPELARLIDMGCREISLQFIYGGLELISWR
jgi:hypothetical protein